jgi:hypothetical protein
MGWSYLVLAELGAGNRGVGYFVVQFQRYLQTNQVFAGWESSLTCSSGFTVKDTSAGGEEFSTGCSAVRQGSYVF